MTLKHIKIFVTVYQEESITRAAEKLHMTQPATSLAIREMEEYYHTKLFERRNPCDVCGNKALSECGKAFVPV